MDAFKSLDRLVDAFYAGKFEPSNYDWFVRGSELFILDENGKELFNRLCGGVIMEVCAIFGVIPDEI